MSAKLGRLYWEQCGKQGQPMFFVHPWPHDRSCWTYQTAHFSTWYRTIVVDLPGFGLSPPAPESVSMQDYADACWETLDRITDEPAILVGLSVGSTIVKYMANARPEQTLALILTGGPFYSEPNAKDVPIEKPFGYAAKRFSAEGIEGRRALVERNFSSAFRQSALGQYFVDLVVERNATADAASIQRMINALMRPDPMWLHEGIACPVLILMGSREKARSRSAHLAMHARIANSELEVIQGAGHCCNLEKPWEYDRRVLSFLSRNNLAR